MEISSPGADASEWSLKGKETQNMILADKIIAERKKKGWTQEELAEMLGVTRQSVSKWEGAQSAPDLERILKMSKIFGVSTDYLLKDELEEVQNTDYMEESESELRRVSMEEANTFLKCKRQTAPKIAWATFLCILSPICLLILSAACEEGMLSLSENAAAGIGMIILLLLVAIAVVVFISCGMATKEYEYLDHEEIETEYGVQGMVKERKKQYEDQYVKCNILGVVFCIMGVVPLFAALVFTEEAFVMVLMLCLLLLLEGIGAVLFIHSGIIQASFQKLLQEGDYSKNKKRNSGLNQSIATAYWLTATAIYLAYSFVTKNWEMSWILWPVAGVLYPAVIVIANELRKEK